MLMPPVSKVMPLPTSAAGPGVAAAPVIEDDQPRFLYRTRRHRKQAAHAELAHLLLVEHIDAQCIEAFGEFPGVAGEIFRRADIARQIAELPGAVHAPADGCTPAQGLLQIPGALPIRRGNAYLLKFGSRLVAGFGGLITIRAGFGFPGQPGCEPVSIAFGDLQVGEFKMDVGDVSGKRLAKACGEILHRRRGVKTLRITRPDEQDSPGSTARRIMQQVGITRFPAIIAASRHRANSTATSHIKRRRLLAEPALVPHRNHQTIGLDRLSQTFADAIPHKPQSSRSTLYRRRDGILSTLPNRGNRARVVPSGYSARRMTVGGLRAE